MLDPAVEKHSTPCSCNYTKCKVIKKFYELHPQDPADVVVEDENEDEDIE